MRRELSRARVVIAAALGGCAPGLLVAIAVALETDGGSAPGDLLPWPLLATAAGAAIGVAGLSARSLGRWLAGRP